MLQPLLILGANNPETVRIVDAVGDFRLLGFLDNDPGKIGSSFMGYPVWGPLSRVERFPEAVVVNSICRTMQIRKETTREVLDRGASLTRLIHPSVDVRYVGLRAGLVVHEGAVLQPEAVIGFDCMINCNAIVSHECRLGDHVFLAPGSVLAGCVTVGECVTIGANATVLPRLTIGEGAVVGAGAVVTKDVLPGQVVAGNPARPIRGL